MLQTIIAIIITVLTQAMTPAQLHSCEYLTERHGYIVEQTYEGYSENNDYYIVNIDGELYEVEADDLNEGDKVTCYFIGDDEIVRTVYEWR